MLRMTPLCHESGRINLVTMVMILFLVAGGLVIGCNYLGGAYTDTRSEFYIEGREDDIGSLDSGLTLSPEDYACGITVTSKKANNNDDLWVVATPLGKGCKLEASINRGNHFEDQEYENSDQGSDYFRLSTAGDIEVAFRICRMGGYVSDEDCRIVLLT